MEISKIQDLLEELCQNIGGKWLLTGGSLIQLQADAERATEDIDLVGLEHESLSDVAAQDAMFKAAIRLGLSPESVNSAAGFFLHQIPDWKAHLVPLRSGARGAVLRPDLTLFVVLKLGRATEVDLRDVASAAAAFGESEFDETAFRRMASPKVLTLFDKHRDAWGL